MVVIPYGDVAIDERHVGEAPVEVRLPAGTHRVRVTGGPNGRRVERDVTVRAGALVTETIAVPR